ncbi:hypothetical protein FGLOB1_6255 [Fusarium globosum]|uniref:Uncharacterized protein n=1 Tax=Fusarium globosum TaxID=78864 RepID=A0A8H6D8W0_9HYPO|nr:hypothetical protein FGLOB1_6255 [Fusarium globosum]
MSSNENNNTLAIPTAGGGYVGITRDGVGLDQLARSMIEAGASSVVVQISAAGHDQDNPTVVTGVLDRDGNFRVLHRTNEADSANN